MRFRDKLFLAVTALLTLIFAIFGSLMLSTYFQKIVNREIERGNTESQMYQYLFEMAYQATEEYGKDYALKQAIESAADTVKTEGVSCFALDEAGNMLYGEEIFDDTKFMAVVTSVLTDLSEENSYVYGLRKYQEQYYLIHICVSETAGANQYLGLCRDMTEIYEDRSSLLNQYRLALVVLLVFGGVGIYVLSRIMTRPIQELGLVAGQIAKGDYEVRSHYKETDEIGELAHSFNHMADKLVKQMKEKELEAKQKEDFTAAFAHELKTPLTSIIGYADMLNTIQLSEQEKQEAYFYIYKQGKRLESLSHKLLELVSMEKSPEVGKRISMKRIEENIRVVMRPIFMNKHIKGRIVFEKAYIQGDEELFLSLLYNLLDNATKAVEENGFILLKGSCVGNEYEIKIVDNGRGIPKEEISRITEAFYMVDKSRSRKEGGAGIGMALCKQIVELHHGTMQIDSKLEEGTVIRLHFPLIEQNSPKNKEKKEEKNEI